MASPVEVKRIIRRKLRARPEREAHALNIYPLMDVMTILLVFMIMQFAQDPASASATAGLEVPESSSDTELAPALPIVVSRTHVVVDGRAVLALRDGRVDAADKQGGGTGFLVTPLHQELTQHRDRLRLIEARDASQPFTGAVQVIADRRIPYRTLSEVLYTLGQAEFANVRFVVLQE